MKLTLLPTVLLPLALAIPTPEDSYRPSNRCPSFTPPDLTVVTPNPKSGLPYFYTELPASSQSTAPILNALSLTALAADGKNYTALGELFTENAVANLGPAGASNLKGRKAILATYEKALANFDTQQSLGTTFAKIYAQPKGQETYFNPGECQASTFTYFTTTFFEKGTTEKGATKGKRDIVVGDFRDRWVNENGVWKILLRIQTVTGIAYDGGLVFT